MTCERLAGRFNSAPGSVEEALAIDVEARRVAEAMLDSIPSR